LIASIRQRAAAKRSRLFRDFVLHHSRPVRVLDLGGTSEMWRRWGVTEADGFEVTLLNHHRIDGTHRHAPLSQRFVRELRADALTLSPSLLAGYDLIFSNSMLEHLPLREDQETLAGLIVGSGLPYFIQVPNKLSPVDPHFPHPFVPFFAIFPRELQARLLTLSELGSGSRAATLADARLQFATYHPLGHADLRRLFPSATLRTQWLLGLPMSIIATWRPASASRKADADDPGRPHRPSLP
jgi:hypothetical protein